jgi:hypothetical protein
LYRHSPCPNQNRVLVGTQHAKFPTSHLSFSGATLYLWRHRSCISLTDSAACSTPSSGIAPTLLLCVRSCCCLLDVIKSPRSVVSALLAYSGLVHLSPRTVQPTSPAPRRLSVFDVVPLSHSGTAGSSPCAAVVGLTHPLQVGGAPAVYHYIFVYFDLVALTQPGIPGFNIYQYAFAFYLPSDDLSFTFIHRFALAIQPMLSALSTSHWPLQDCCGLAKYSLVTVLRCSPLFSRCLVAVIQFLEHDQMMIAALSVKV